MQCSHMRVTQGNNVAMLSRLLEAATLLCCAESNLDLLCFWVLLILLFPKGMITGGKIFKTDIFEGDLRLQKLFIAEPLGSLLL